MKQIHILPAILVLGSAIALTSCSTSRVWENNDSEGSSKSIPHRSPSRHYVTTPLILTPNAGFVMNRYPDGRFYHRSPQGFTYWKAYDNRFYLDRSSIHRVRYDRFEYDQWKQYYRSVNDRNPYR